MNPKDINVICFHSPCQDGTASAWVASKYARENNLTYEFVQMSHSHEPIFEYEGKNVAFFDIAPKDKLLHNLESKAKDYYILDHHVTNQERMSKCSKCIFNMNKSGVGLAWEYFYPNDEMPKFLCMIQDRDLWKFEIPTTKAFCNGFYVHTGLTTSLEETFNLYDELYNDSLNSDVLLNNIIDLGNLLEKQKQNKIRKIAKTTCKKTYYYNGLKVAIVNCEPDIGSDMGNFLVSDCDYDFAVCWRYNHVNEEYYISLRSNGDMDVSQIAKTFGGGGHKNAAGCTIKKHPSLVFNNTKKQSYVSTLLKKIGLRKNN